MVNYPASKDTNPQDNDFANNHDGTVTDIRTSLIWMRCLLGQSMERGKCVGISYAYAWENASLIRHGFANSKDWRLPTFDELEFIFGSQSNRSENETLFPWLAYDVAGRICLWSSTTFNYDDEFAVNSYYPGSSNIVYCTGECLNDSIQVLLVRSVDSIEDAVLNANLVPPVTIMESEPSEKAGSAIDATNVTSLNNLLHDLIERFDRLDTRFEIMMNCIETLMRLLPQSKSATDALSQDRTDSTDTAMSVATTRLEFLQWLVEQPEIVFTDLRTRLLPLDLLPSAFIDDINERALDLADEQALEEDGDNVLVRPKVLQQVIAVYAGLWNTA